MQLPQVVEVVDIRVEVLFRYLVVLGFGGSGCYGFMSFGGFRGFRMGCRGFGVLVVEEVDI